MGRKHDSKFGLFLLSGMLVVGSAGCQKSSSVPAFTSPAPEAIEAVTAPPIGTIVASADPLPTIPQVELPQVVPAPAESAEASLPTNKLDLDLGVRMSDVRRETCRKLVGDSFDDVTVVDIDGTHHQLQSLLSDRLTVIIFWNDDSTLALEQFRRIPVDILATFAERRVKVIAVHVGGDIPRTRQLTGDAADKIVSLVDADQSLLQQVATSIIPRTYVVDNTGKILWFDVEYSLDTQRTLTQALRSLLGIES